MIYQLKPKFTQLILDNRCRQELDAHHALLAHPGVRPRPPEDFFLKNGPFSGLFFFFLLFSVQLTVNVQYNFLLMTGFEPRTSAIVSDRSTNWATTIAPATPGRLIRIGRLSV